MPFESLWPGIGLIALIVAAAATDVARGKIHNAVTYPAIALGLIGHTLVDGINPPDRMGLVGAIGGVAAGAGPVLVPYLAGGFKGGDLKLMAGIGALMGWRFAIMTLFVGLAIAAIMAIVVMLRKRIFRRTMARILRFLYLAFMRARPADPATEESPKIPVGVAFCIGAVAIMVLEACKPGLASRLLGL